MIAVVRTKRQIAFPALHWVYLVLNWPDMYKFWSPFWQLKSAKNSMTSLKWPYMTPLPTKPPLGNRFSLSVCCTFTPFFHLAETGADISLHVQRVTSSPSVAPTRWRDGSRPGVHDASVAAALERRAGPAKRRRVSTQRRTQSASRPRGHPC